MNLRALIGPWLAAVTLLVGGALWLMTSAVPPKSGSPAAPATPKTAADWRPGDRPPGGGAPPPPDPRIYQIALAQADGTQSLPEILEISHRLNEPEGNIHNDLETVQQLFSIYSRFNDNAVPAAPDNEGITSMLRGNNPKRFSVLPPGSSAKLLNAKGELIDRWGTPYFMHTVSRELIEIRSAGPDRILWNGDDTQLPETSYYNASNAGPVGG
ncbi:MAG TPA: hypothetical protein VIS74_00320 [Chthoniobacterales bacterium]